MPPRSLSFFRKPSQKTINELYKKRLRNPNNSRYGLNITRIFDTYIIKKRIAGDDYIFGYYESLEDAEFVRNHLLENDWDVSGFSQIPIKSPADMFSFESVSKQKSPAIHFSISSAVVFITPGIPFCVIPVFPQYLEKGFSPIQ